VAGLVSVAGALWLTYGSAGFPGQFWHNLTHWGASLPVEVVLLVAAVYLWRRGIVLGRSALPYTDLENAFYLGIGALAALLIANGLYQLLSPAEAAGPVLVVFLSGLSALALASFERFRRQQKEIAGTAPALSRHWLLTIGNVIGAILVGGLLLAGAVSPDLLRGLLGSLAVLLTPLVSLGLGLITASLFWVLYPLAEAFVRALVHLQELLRSLFGLSGDIAEPATRSVIQDAVAAFLNSPVIKATGGGLTMILVLATVALAFWLVVRRFARLPGRDVDETRENLLTRELIAAQLSALWPARRQREEPAPSFLPVDGPDDDPARRIRRAYQDLLDWAQVEGQARAPGQTPDAYGQRLAVVWPGEAEAIKALTAAYIPARYGGTAEAPTAETAQRAEAAADHVLARAHQRQR
jgi:hypothetical protein